MSAATLTARGPRDQAARALHRGDARSRSSRTARSAARRPTPRSSARSSTAATSTRRAPRWCRRGWRSRWSGCSRSTSRGRCPTSSPPTWRTSSTRSPAVARDRATELGEFYYGAGDVVGLKTLVTELGDIDAKEMATFPIGEGIDLRVGRYGPYVEGPAPEDGDGAPVRANVPDDLPPDELTSAKAKRAAGQPGRRGAGASATTPTPACRSSPRTAASAPTSPSCCPRTRPSRPSRAPARSSSR